MKNALLSLFSIMFFVSCKTESKFTFSLVNSVKYDTICNMLLSRDIQLDNKMEDNNCLLFYLSTNECAECLSNTMDFNKMLKAEGSNPPPTILWITGNDNTIMEYYMNQNDFKLSEKTILCIDTGDEFHYRCKCVYTNALFVLTKDKKVYLVKSILPVSDWKVEDIIDDLSVKYKTQSKSMDYDSD